MLQVGNGGTTGSIIGNVTNGGTLEFSRTDPTTFAGAISGLGVVAVDSGGALTLSATNTYNGGTTVTGGATLIANHHENNGIDALGSGAVTLNNGVLSDGTSNAINNSVIIGAGGGTLAGSGFTFNGGITGAGGLVYATSVSATGADTRTAGATLITNNSTLSVYNPASLSAQSDISINVGSTLALTSFRSSAYAAGSRSGGGTVLADTNSGQTQTLSIGGSGTSTAFSGALQDGVDSLAVTKTGTGVFMLTGANTYTGATAVNGGVLAVDGAIASAATVNSGGTLSGTGTTGGVTLAMGGVLSPGDYAAGASSVGHLSTGAITLAAGALRRAAGRGVGNLRRGDRLGRGAA